MDTIRISSFSYTKDAANHLFIEHPICYCENNSKWQSPLKSELWTATELIQALPISCLTPDWLILCSSLPRRHNALILPSIIKQCKLQTPMPIEMGGNCSSALTALHYAFTSLSKLKSGILLCIDSFQTSYALDSAGTTWKDGGAGIKFGLTGIKLVLRSYATATDVHYLDMAHSPESELIFGGAITPMQGFVESDLKTVEALTETVLQNSDLSLNKIDAVVLTNISEARVLRFRNHLGWPREIYWSRPSFGHRGGSDLLHNLGLFIKKINRKNIENVLLIGHGLGYTWNAMVLEVGNE